MIPGQGLLRLLAGWLGLALLAAAVPAAVVPWQVLGLAILVATALAAAGIARAPALTVERQVLPSLPLGERSDVRLRLESDADTTLFALFAWAFLRVPLASSADRKLN